MKKKIMLIIIIIVYVGYIVLNLIQNNSKQYILFDSNTIIIYKDNQIKSIKYVDAPNARLNYEKFYIYNDNDIFDEYYINFIKEENNIYSEIYSKYNEKEKLTRPLLAYKGDLNLKVAVTKKVTELSAEDKKLLSQIVDEFDINSDYLYFTKNIIDIDNDGEMEIIYSVDNYNSWNNEKIFCINFLQENDGTIIEINRETASKTDVLNVPRRHFTWAIDIDFDNDYEIILSNNVGDDSPTYYEFYKYDSKSTEILELKYEQEE